MRTPKEPEMNPEKLPIQPVPACGRKHMGCTWIHLHLNRRKQLETIVYSKTKCKAASLIKACNYVAVGHTKRTYSWNDMC